MVVVMVDKVYNFRAKNAVMLQMLHALYRALRDKRDNFRGKKRCESVESVE